jgi:cytidylate kinase
MTQQCKSLKIAIDGPAGAGKSSVAREVAKRLKIKYLDTGAMYRAVTLKFIRDSIDLNDPTAVHRALEEINIRFSDDQRIFLNGDDVTAEIRFPAVNKLVSPVSAISAVRSCLVKMQQSIAEKSHGIIMEGRDIASIVMPDADFKFYLDASVAERARRRKIEQLEKGIDFEENAVIKEIAARDKLDSGRADSPLTIVPGAIVIDTTRLSFNEVVESILDEVKKVCS